MLLNIETTDIVLTKYWPVLTCSVYLVEVALLNIKFPEWQRRFEDSKITDHVSKDVWEQVPKAVVLLAIFQAALLYMFAAHSSKRLE